MDEEAIRHLRGIDRTLRTSALAALLLIAVWVLRDILLLGFAAVLMACILRGASELLHRRTGLGSGLSLLAVVVAAALFLAILLWWRGTAIAEQAVQMVDQLTNQAQRLWGQLETTPWGALVARQLRGAVESARNGLSGYVPGVASSVLGVGGSVVVVIATALFQATSPQMYVRGSLRLLPTSWRPRGREVAQHIGTTLQLWFLGQLADMIIVTILVGAGLFLLGVPLAMTLAILCRIAKFCPLCRRACRRRSSDLGGIFSVADSGAVGDVAFRRRTDARGKRHRTVDPKANDFAAPSPYHLVANDPGNVVRSIRTHPRDATCRGTAYRRLHDLHRGRRGRYEQPRGRTSALKRRRLTASVGLPIGNRQ